MRHVESGQGEQTTVLPDVRRGRSDAVSPPNQQQQRGLSARQIFLPNSRGVALLVLRSWFVDLAGTWVAAAVMIGGGILQVGQAGCSRVVGDL